MTRVLWLVKGLGPGGAERLLVAAATRLPPDVQAECAYVLPWKDHLTGDLEAAGVRCVCLGDRGWRLRWVAALARLVRNGGFDVVHGHSPLPMSAARLAASTMPKHRRPVLLSTEHNSWATYRWPTRLLNRATVGRDRRVWAVSDEVAASTGGRAVALRHGIDVAAVAATADRTGVRAELGIADGDPIIGTVANFRAQKDYPNLLRAFRAVLDSGCRATLLVVGQGPLEAETRALANELGLDGSVVFTGFRADATRVMSAFDVFVLASRWEGLPVAVMEACALGLPIVATDVGGVAETFTDDVDAVLVAPGDPGALSAALVDVLHDDVGRQRLATAARQRAGEFDTGPSTAVMVEAYRSAAPAPATPSSPPSRRALDTAYEIREATPADRPAIMSMLSASLGWDAGDERFAAMYAWKHDANVFGPSPTWVAVHDGQVVGVRAFMRWEFERGGEPLRVCRAVDTATHPEHRGAGLFRALTLHGIDHLRADGVAFIFNTPNAQSRPGYLKMGWRDVGRVPVAVRVMHSTRTAGMVRTRVAANHWSEPIEVGVPVDQWLAGNEVAWSPPTDVRSIATRVDEAFARWRFGFEPLHYRVVDDDAAAVAVRLRWRGSSRELVHAATLRGPDDRADRLVVHVAKQVAADHALRLGAGNLRRAFVPAPMGPRLTWRAVNEPGQPPLHNWHLTMADVELF